MLLGLFRWNANKRLSNESESAPTVSNRRIVIYKKRPAAPGPRGSSAPQRGARVTVSITCSGLIPVTVVSAAAFRTWMSSRKSISMHHALIAH